MKIFAALIAAALSQGFGYNLPDSTLDPVGNWGPLTFYPDSAEDRLYKLPWDSGTVRYLNDGAYNRPASHHKGYEFDFDMPIGSPVIAARSGYVHLFTGYEGSADPYNTVLEIIHSDVDSVKRHTTVDWYVHVQDTSLSRLGLKRGQFIHQGELIALSGKDGSYAHLHLEIQEMSHIGVGGFKNGAYQPIESIPAPFVEVTQWKDGVPFRYISLKSQNKRYSSTANEQMASPGIFGAFYCAPNPFQNRTVFHLPVEGAGTGCIGIFDAAGRKVGQAVSSPSGAAVWTPLNLPAGRYAAQAIIQGAVFHSTIYYIR